MVGGEFLHIRITFGTVCGGGAWGNDEMAVLIHLGEIIIVGFFARATITDEDGI